MHAARLDQARYGEGFAAVACDFAIEFFKTAPNHGANAGLASAINVRSGESITDDSSGQRISLAHPTVWAGYALVGD